MAYDHIRLELNEPALCATLVLDEPPSNLLGIAAIEEVNDALLSLRGRPWLEVLVMRGANGTFSEGFDLTEHVPKRVRRLLQVYIRFFETIRMMDVISIAAVEGHAWGAGFELALGCNLLVAAETASFALPQVTQGLIPPVATAILRRLEHDGVVSRVFPPDAFEERLASFVAEITSKSGPVLQLAKRAQFESYYSSFPDALQSIQSLYLHELLKLDDAQEGTRAALEGREPVWKQA
jgi:enoyl-CoA hydratase